MLTPHSLYAAVSVGLETETIISVLDRLSKALLLRLTTVLPCYTVCPSRSCCLTSLVSTKYQQRKQIRQQSILFWKGNETLLLWRQVSLSSDIKDFIKASTGNYGKAKMVLQRNKFYVESAYPDVLKALLEVGCRLCNAASAGIVKL